MAASSMATAARPSSLIGSTLIHNNKCPQEGPYTIALLRLPLLPSRRRCIFNSCKDHKAGRTLIKSRAAASSSERSLIKNGRSSPLVSRADSNLSKGESEFGRHASCPQEQALIGRGRCVKAAMKRAVQKELWTTKAGTGSRSMMLEFPSWDDDCSWVGGAGDDDTWQIPSAAGQSTAYAVQSHEEARPPPFFAALIAVLGLRIRMLPSTELGLHASGSGEEASPAVIACKKACLFVIIGTAIGLTMTSALPAMASVATTASATVPRMAPLESVIHALASTELLSSAWTGLVAGCLHTLTGPDHLAALAPLSIGRSKLESAGVGALWGFGHDTGQVLFGLIFLLLKDKLRLDLIQTWGARIVGMTLIGIGLLGVKESREVPQLDELMATTTGEMTAAATAGAGAGTGAGGSAWGSSNEGAAVFDRGVKKKNVNLVTTFATGIIHGLQPDALLMILPALAIPSKLAGAAFLMMFLIGTVVAMGSYTAFIGVSSRALGRRIPWVTQRLSLVSSIIAMLVGTTILLPGGLARFLPFASV